jgi:hypothetical protein
VFPPRALRKPTLITVNRGASVLPHAAIIELLQKNSPRPLDLEQEAAPRIPSRSLRSARSQMLWNFATVLTFGLV